MRRRVRSLLVPFVIASISFPLFFIIIEKIPGAISYINSTSYLDLLSEMSLRDIVISLFYDSGNGSPWAFHLWFLRDLITLVILAPVLYWLRRCAKYWSIFISFVLYVLWPQVPFLYAMYWFLAGSLLLDKLDSFPKWIIYIISGLFVLIAVCDQLILDGIMGHYSVIYISMGVISMWSFYSIVVPTAFKLDSCHLLRLATQFSFFIYLYHEPFFQVVVKGVPILVGYTPFGYSLSFLLSPLLFLPIIIATGYCLKRMMPVFFSLITGGR